MSLTTRKLTLKLAARLIGIAFLSLSWSVAADFCQTVAGDPNPTDAAASTIIERAHYTMTAPSGWAPSGLPGYFAPENQEGSASFLWVNSGPDVDSAFIANDLLSIFGADPIKDPACVYNGAQLQWRLYRQETSSQQFVVALASHKDLAFAILLAADSSQSLNRYTAEVLLPVLKTFEATPQDKIADHQTATVFLLRHANKDLVAKGSPLTEKGHERARALSKLLGDIDIDAIFVTNALRTQQTAAPLAAKTGIEPQVLPADAQDELLNIINNGAGKTYVVVHHSHSIPGLLEDLGAHNIPYISSHQYDNLFVITMRGDTRPVVVKLNYGELDPD